MTNIEILGEIWQKETIAVGSKIREISRLRKRYGSGRWRKLKGIARVRYADGTIAVAEVPWYEAHGIGKERVQSQTDSATMNRQNGKIRFAVCVNNKGYEVSLERRKIYQVLPDAGAEKHGMVRILDESGEDYLFPATWFVPIALPLATQRALRMAR